MKINPDMVPINLEEAVKTLKEGLTPADFEEIKKDDFDAAKVHFTVGMMLRNEWSLWDKDSIMVRWFKENYGIEHADDVSGLILDCLVRDVQGLPRRDKELAKRYINHWKSISEQEK
jgi:hypothetical protein